MLRFSTVSALALVALTLAACEREVILEGERFGTRVPLEASLPTETDPSPAAPADQANAVVPIALPAMQANADWTHRAGNNRHDMPHGALSAQPQRVFSSPIGTGNSRRARIAAAPVVADGRVFTLDAAGQVAATGTGGGALWASSIVPATEKGGDVSGGGLAYGGGRLFVASGYGELLALDPVTGAILWRQRLASAATGAPMVEGDTVYVMGRDATGWAVDVADGKVRWNVTGTPGTVGMLSTAAPSVAGRAIVFPLVSGELVGALNLGGQKIWTAAIVGGRTGRGWAGLADVTGDPVVQGGVIYAGNAAGRVYAVRASNGETIWTAPEASLGAVIAAGGSVFTISDENRLVRLDAATGARIWSVEMPFFTADKPRKHKGVVAHYGPVMAGGRIAVASGDGVLRMFDPASGAMVATAEIPGGAASAPALAGGMLYVVGGDGQLHAFR